MSTATATARTRRLKTSARSWIVPELIRDRALSIVCGPDTRVLDLVALDLAASVTSARPFASTGEGALPCAAARVAMVGPRYVGGLARRFRPLLARRADLIAEHVEERVFRAKILPTFGEPAPGELTPEELGAMCARLATFGGGETESFLAIVAAPEPLELRAIERLAAIASAEGIAMALLAPSDVLLALCGGTWAGYRRLFAGRGEDSPFRSGAPELLRIEGDALLSGAGISEYCVARFRVEEASGEGSEPAEWIEWERPVR